jgi:putative ABC transport system permease protein
MTLAVRTKNDSINQVSAIQRELAAIDPSIPLGNVRTVERLLDEAVAPRRVFMGLVTCFAGLAILLAVGGIYSVISYSVAQRTREIGVRMALGATYADVLALMVRQASRVLVAGLGLGVVMSLGATRPLKAMLFGIQSNDFSTFLVSAGLMTFVALGAIFVPARHAATINPVMAIRHE